MLASIKLDFIDEKSTSNVENESNSIISIIWSNNSFCTKFKNILDFNKNKFVLHCNKYYCMKAHQNNFNSMMNSKMEQGILNCIGHQCL